MESKVDRSSTLRHVVPLRHVVHVQVVDTLVAVAPMVGASVVGAALGASVQVGAALGASLVGASLVASLVGASLVQQQHLAQLVLGLVRSLPSMALASWTLTSCAARTSALAPPLSWPLPLLHTSSTTTCEI